MFGLLGIVVKFNGNIFGIREVYLFGNSLRFRDYDGLVHDISFNSNELAKKVFGLFWECCREGKRFFYFNKVDEHGEIKNGYVC